MGDGWMAPRSGGYQPGKYDPQPHIVQLPAQTTKLTAEQFQEWLNAPGTIYQIGLPGQKTFVIKVPEEHSGFFIEFMRHLRKQLGAEVSATKMTPTEPPPPAHPARKPTILDRFRRLR